MSYIHKKPKKYSTIVGTSSQRKTKEKKSATTVSKRIELPLLSILETVVVQLACRKKCSLKKVLNLHLLFELHR